MLIGDSCESEVATKVYLPQSMGVSVMNKNIILPWGRWWGMGVMGCPGRLACVWQGIGDIKMAPGIACD